MTDKKKNKSTAKKAEPVEPKVSDAKRRENALASMSTLEDQYPGITEQYLRFENAE